MTPEHPPFACPVCHGPLVVEPLAMRCDACHESYRFEHGFPVLIAQRFIDEFKETEQHFHDELSESALSGSVAGRNSVFHRQFERPMLNLPDKSAVLEVACGTRVDGIEIVRSGKLVTSIDLSPDAVEHAKHLADQNGADAIRFAAADAEHLPFTDGSFDAVFVAASFHHFPNQPAALRELKRVTKAGGYVIWGVEPASWPYRSIYKFLAPVKRHIRANRDRHFNSIADDTTEGYTEPQIKRLFSEAGLSIESLQRVKMMSELYDSGVRMIGRLMKKQLRPSRSVDHVLAHIDRALCAVPLLNRLSWHFNVISRVPSA